MTLQQGQGLEEPGQTFAADPTLAQGPSLGSGSSGLNTGDMVNIAVGNSFIAVDDPIQSEGKCGWEAVGCLIRQRDEFIIKRVAWIK